MDGNDYYSEDEFKKMLENTTLMQMKENIKNSNGYGIDKSYNRQKFDDPAKRRQIKEEFFGGKKTQTDYITGETLHINTQAAKNKYGQNSYTKHTADVDHIIPEKTAYENLSKNPFLTEADTKKIINDESNYRVTASKHNRHKSDSSNLNLLTDDNYSLEEKARLAGDHVKASASMDLNEAKYTAKNIVNDAAETTKLTLEAAAIPLAVEGVYNLIQVADGKKDFEEAAAEMGLLTTSIVVKANAVSLATTQLTNIMKDSAVQVFKDIVNANIVGQIVTVSAIVGSSVVKLINGELTGEQFFNEIGRQGVELIGGSIGAVAGQLLIPIPVVGAMVGSVVISGVCGMVYNVTTSILKAATTLDDYKKREREIAVLSAEAINEINRQNKVVKELIENQFGEWDLSFNKGFELIGQGAVNFDVETIASGLDSILNVFGEKVRFSTRNEFDKFFDNDDAVFVF